MIDECFRTLQHELAFFTGERDRDSSSSCSSTCTPAIRTKEWVMKESAIIIQQYPHSLSRAVLLTELESRWRSEIRRGEHGGKLQQMVSTQQLSLDTIVQGRLRRIDAHRCQLVEGAAAVDMIMHRQFHDFVAFSRYSVPDYDVLDNRLCSFINCSLLPFAGTTPILLPCPLGILYLDVVNHSGDARFYQNILKPMHDFFCRTSTKGKGDLQSLTDPGAVSTVFVQVLYVGECRPHPTRLQSQYQVTRLRLLFTKNVETCIILFDEQLRLSSMWQPGQVLLLFRPFVALNADETLFGSAVHTAAPMAYSVVSKPAPELSYYGSLETVMPVHFLYGAVTVVAEVAGISEEHIGEHSRNDVNDDTDGCLLVRVLYVNLSVSERRALLHGQKPMQPFATMLLAKVEAAIDPTSMLLRVVIPLHGSGEEEDEQLRSSLTSVRGGHLLLLGGLTMEPSDTVASSTELAKETASAVDVFRSACGGTGCSACQAGAGRFSIYGSTVNYGIPGRHSPASATAMPCYTLGGRADTHTLSRRSRAILVNVSRLAALTTSPSLLGSTPPRCLCSSQIRFSEGLLVITARFVRCQAPIGHTRADTPLCAGGICENITAIGVLESAEAPNDPIHCFYTPDTLNMSSVDPLQRRSDDDRLLRVLLTRIDDVGGVLADSVSNELQLAAGSFSPLFRVEIITDLVPQ